MSLLQPRTVIFTIVVKVLEVESLYTHWGMLHPTYPSLHSYFPFQKIASGIWRKIKVASISNHFPSIPILTTLYIYPDINLQYDSSFLRLFYVTIKFKLPIVIFHSKVIKRYQTSLQCLYGNNTEDEITMGRLFQIQKPQ